MSTSGSDEAIRQHTNDVVDSALEMLLAHDMNGFGRLWAPTGAMEFPFAAPGQPDRLDGQAAILAYLDGYTDMLDIRDIVSQTRHQTFDPETVIVEFEVGGIAVASQRPYRMRYVAAITVRADGIANYRDYWSPLAAADVLAP